MTINFIKIHDQTKGPEKHRTFIFDLVSDTPGEGHSPTIFEYEGDKFRAFRTYSQVPPQVIDGKKYPVARVCAVKVADEMEWNANGKHGKIAEGVLTDHTSR